jgi:transcriptional regulator with XRE-family HTH domain
MNEFNSSEFGNRLKLSLKKSNINQKDLAEKINVSKTSINNYANGRVPEAQILYKISKICGTTMEYLLCGEVNDIEPIEKNEDSQDTSSYNLTAEAYFENSITSSWGTGKSHSITLTLKELLKNTNDLIEAPATKENIIRLANYLGLKAGIEDEMPGPDGGYLTDDEAECLKFYNQLDERSKGKILGKMDELLNIQKDESKRGMSSSISTHGEEATTKMA